ncbi:MAG: thiolase family protein [Gracilibacteraceae bacterium]|jgi:acetyl-CoA C-acetyltransferase|nr:thiolase family protein [Gracilibacteraceae bacterium]
MNEAVIVDFVRTPIGTIGGSLKNVQPETLLAAAFTAIMQRTNLAPHTVDEVIAGQAKQSSDQPNIARLSALLAGLPEDTPAFTVHRQCASSMQALLSAQQQIQCGYSEIVLVGGVESMSTASFYLRNARFGIGNGNCEFLDPNTESQPRSQPVSVYGSFNMIQTADRIAELYQISREECDEFSLCSQKKAVLATDSGRFETEIIPVTIPQIKGESKLFNTDEYPKRDVDLEKMKKLKSIFNGGVTTAGNASGRNDGAAAALLMTPEKAKQYHLRPLARLIAGCAAGVDPRVMGIGPVASTKLLMKKLLSSQGIDLSDFELIEINEAFAAQALACIRELNLEPEKVNVNGGAIALGHPIGCSGLRICCTLIHEMRKRNSRLGLGTICAAGGLGMSMAFESL